jgi:hypothetical protein
MPGPTTSIDDQRERVLPVAELHQFIGAGLVVSLRDVRVQREDQTTDEYMLVYIRGHGVALMSKQSDQCYMLTDYGLVCLALGAGLERPLDLILTPDGEVSRG